MLNIEQQALGVIILTDHERISHRHPFPVRILLPQRILGVPLDHIVRIILPVAPNQLGRRAVKILFLRIDPLRLINSRARHVDVPVAVGNIEQRFYVVRAVRDLINDHVKMLASESLSDARRIRPLERDSLYLVSEVVRCPAPGRNSNFMPLCDQVIHHMYPKKSCPAKH